MRRLSRDKKVRGANFGAEQTTETYECSPKIATELVVVRIETASLMPIRTTRKG